jgi:outer membrane protein TolC
VASYERSVQTAFREVADALSARHHLARQTQVQRDNLQVLQERARLAQLRYDNGASPYLDVLDAQRDLLTAAQQAVQARTRCRPPRSACTRPWVAHRPP